MRVFALLLGCAAALAVQPALAQTSAATTVATTADDDNPVDPEAVAALKAMSTFLHTVQTFRMTSVSSLDVITEDNQKVQIDSVTNYQVKRPGIRIDWVSDQKNRSFYYDGSHFTLLAPTLGYYSTIDAPPTNREFLKALYDRTGIELPLEDLFRWADADHQDAIDQLTSAFSVGTATIDGAHTDHWAFRSDHYDWEIWIEQGDRPIPRKFVLIDRTDPALPSFTARLTWQLNPVLDPAVFTYAPTANAIAIAMSAPSGEAAQ